MVAVWGVKEQRRIRALVREKANFTNEGGYAHRFRFLKNIMGLWMIQSVQKEFLRDIRSKE